MKASHLVATALASVLLASAALDGVAVAHAQSTGERKKSSGKKGGLAGKEGDVKIRIMFPAEWEGGCGGLYKRYVAASGHSAYAATIVDYFYGGTFVCGSRTNAGSQAEAERLSIASCEASRKKHKSLKPVGNCRIYASK